MIFFAKFGYKLRTVILNIHCFFILYFTSFLHTVNYALNLRNRGVIIKLTVYNNRGRSVLKRKEVHCLVRQILIIFKYYTADKIACSGARNRAFNGNADDFLIQTLKVAFVNLLPSILYFFDVARSVD